MSNEMNIDELYRVFEKIKIKNLLTFLAEKSEEYSNMDEDDTKKEYELLLTKKAIINILIILLNKFDKTAINDLKECSEVLYK